MKFVLETTLKRRALTAIAAIMWNGPDARRLFSDLAAHHTDNKNISAVQQKIETSIESLIIPESLKKEVSKFSERVSVDILEWIKHHIELYELAVQVPENFVWTAHGIIDQRKTAEVLVHNEIIPVKDRFKIACLYCIEEQIFTLWPQLDENSMNVIAPPPDFDQNYIVWYWSNYVKSRLTPPYPIDNETDVSSSTVLHSSIIMGNEVATRFFYSKIAAQRDAHLVGFMERVLSRSVLAFEFIPFGQLTQTLLFLLNSIDETQQIKLFQSIPFAILCLFLEWPWQDNFMKVYIHIGQHLSEENFFGLLERILGKLNRHFKDFDYKQIYIDLWMQAPASYRKYIFDKKLIPLLSCLKKVDKELLELTLKKIREANDSDWCRGSKRKDSDLCRRKANDMKRSRIDNNYNDRY